MTEPGTHPPGLPVWCCYLVQGVPSTWPSPSSLQASCVRVIPTANPSPIFGVKGWGKEWDGQTGRPPTEDREPHQPLLSMCVLWSSHPPCEISTPPSTLQTRRWKLKKVKPFANLHSREVKELGFEPVRPAGLHSKSPFHFNLLPHRGHIIIIITFAPLSFRKVKGGDRKGEGQSPECTEGTGRGQVSLPEASTPTASPSPASPPACPLARSPSLLQPASTQLHFRAARLLRKRQQ